MLVSGMPAQPLPVGTVGLIQGHTSGLSGAPGAVGVSGQHAVLAGAVFTEGDGYLHYS